MEQRKKRALEIEQEGWVNFGAYWSALDLKIEETTYQARRVNPCVSCIVTSSVFLLLLVVFLEVSSFEFPVERFLVTCVRETLINEWDT
jgi:hypothetical protein